MKKKIKIIDTISKKEKSETYVVAFDGGTTFFKLKKYQGKEIKKLYIGIKNIESQYISKIIDIWDGDGCVFVLEEYVSGETLREIIDKGNVPKESVKQYMLMICEALKALHNNEPKIVHRDVKPENIIVTRDGKIKLIDFDIARIYKQNGEHDTLLMGTRDYASPEQFGYMQTDERSDIYSAGILLKELYYACGDKSLYIRYLQRIIKKATRFDPEKRYSSIEKMENDIGAVYFEKIIRLVIGFVAALLLVLVTVMAAMWTKGRLGGIR